MKILNTSRIGRWLQLLFFIAAFCAAPVVSGRTITLSLEFSRLKYSTLDPNYAGQTYYTANVLVSSDVPPVTTDEVDSPILNGSTPTFSGTESGYGRGFFGDPGSAVNAVTNGTWTLIVNKGDVSEKQYTFTVSSSEPNETNFPAIQINAPADGSPAVSTNVSFNWSGPAVWDELDLVDHSLDYSFYISDSPDPSTTSWSAGSLPLGTNEFEVAYATNAAVWFNISVPVDNLSHPFTNWVSGSKLVDFAQSGFVTVTNPPVISSGHTLLAYYSFEDNNLFAHDYSGQGNNIGGYANYSRAPYITNDALAGMYAFGAAGDGWLTPPTNLLAALGGSFSVSMWVKTSVVNGNDAGDVYSAVGFVSAFNGNQNNAMPLGLNGSKLSFYTGGTSSDMLHSQASINTGQYVHVVATRDQTTGEKKLYVNGVLDATDVGTTELLNDPTELDIAFNNGNTFTGEMDEIQIYSGVLSAAEIAALYANPGTTAPNVSGGAGGLVAYYDFDEGTVLAPDVSGNNNNIIFAGDFGGNGSTISSDTVAGFGSVNFDGGSYLTASPNLLATLAGEFSVSLWLKTSQSFGNQGDLAWQGAGVITADSPNSDDKDVIPVALTGGQVAFNVGDGNGDDTLNSSTIVNDGVWHHIVVTRNLATGWRQIFIDGLLDSSKSGTTNLLDSSVLLTVGAISDATDPDPSSPSFNGYNGYDGLLDDIQIYSRVLSSDDVAYLHTNPGAVLSGGSVIVTAVPVITVNPINQTNYPGYNVALLAAAAGNPTPTWQWFEVGPGAISGATNALYIPANSGNASVAGNYYAMASNSNGTATTATATVTFSNVAPLPDWTHAIGTPYHAEFDTNVIKDYYGGCVVDSTGNVYVADQYAGDVILRTNFVTVDTLTSAGIYGATALVKHDSSGNPIWAVGLTNNQTSSYSYADCVALAPGNGAYLASTLIGTNWLGTNQFANSGNGGASILLSRFDANGSNVWSRLIGRTNQISPFYNTFVSDASGNVTIAGYINGSADFGGTTLTATGFDGFIAQYNSDGTLLWVQHLPAYPQNLAGHGGCLYVSLATTVSGGVTNTSIGSLSNLTDRAWAIACLAATNGHALWLRGVGEQYGAKTNGGFSDDIPLISASGSDVFVTGTAYGSSAMFDGFSVSLPNGRSQYFARYDTNGNAQVATGYGGVTTMPWATVANSSGVYVSGDFDSYSQFGNAFIAAPVNTTNYLGTNYFTQSFIAKFDRNGNPLWARNGTSSLQASYRGVAATADGVWASGILYVAGVNQPAQFGTNDIGSNFYLDYFGYGVIALPTQGGLLTKITEIATALPVTLINAQTVGANFQFQFPSQSGFNYNILYRTNLVAGNWLTNSTVVGDGSVKTISFPLLLFNGSPQGFIRVSAQ